MQRDQRIAERLVLGTAQLGMSYGVANTVGQPLPDDAREMIRKAWEGGIRIFDTAQAYGSSETVLGRALKDLSITGEARVITKLDPRLDLSNSATVVASVEQSLKRLHIPRVYGLMLHHEGDMDLLHRGLGEELEALIRKGCIEHAGVSLYSTSMAAQAMGCKLLRSIQVPANILDRRFSDVGVFAMASKASKEVYIRSVLLQGLLLMEIDHLPRHFQFARDVLNVFFQLAREYKLTPLEAALGYVKCKYPLARILFGAETPDQVEKNITAWSIDMDKTFIADADNRFHKVEESIINPLLWDKKENESHF